MSSIQYYQQYDEQRKARTKKVTHLFEERYQQFFDVSAEGITDVENAIDGPYATAPDTPPNRVCKDVDGTGTDKIIKGSRFSTYVAERAREIDIKNQQPRDPSLRFSTRGDHTPPYEAWVEAAKNGTAFHPGIMAFGVYGPGVGGPRFETFAMIKMRPWLEAVAEGRIDHIGSFGTNAYYYPLDRLREIGGCVLYEE